MTKNRRLFSIVIILISGLFVFNYLLGWIQALRLANAYYLDAEAAYGKGDFLNALTGYKEFNAEREKYIQRGGYLQVERIWQHPYAWPRPVVFKYATIRIQEIIQSRLTIPMAEGFVQANIGKGNPYLGIVYLRLGELYEQEGDRLAARDVYKVVIESFPGQPELAARAQGHLDAFIQP